MNDNEPITFMAGERELTLEYDANSFADICAELGVGIKEALAMLDRGEDTPLHALRAVFWAGLRLHQPTLTVAQAGNLLFQCGADLGPKLMSALTSAAEVLNASPLVLAMTKAPASLDS